jgi:signal transduction histidine kinase/ActR/RegA family two-component response regulator
LSVEQLLQDADLLSVPVMIVSAEGAIVAVSRAAQNRLGLVAAEVTGRRLAQLTGDDRAYLAQYLRACARSGAFLPGSIRLPGRQGVPIACRCEGAVVQPSHGEVPALILLRLHPPEDTPDRFHALNQKIDELNREVLRRREVEAALRETDRRKDEFLATLAHELRNPLAPISNALELLGRANGNSEMTEQARGMMERQVRLLVRLIDDLLEISRITRGKVELRQERVEIATVVQNAIETASPAIERRHHALTTTFQGTPIYLQADPARLAQVFANLLDNAAKYTDPGGQIHLSVRRQGSEVFISVRDTGIGIPAQYLPRLFEMFSQVNPALERTQGGLGIGLALARRLVELHGGAIEARSAGAGMGSEFVVTLPLPDRGRGVIEMTDAPEQSGGTAPKRRVLIVDDNRDAAASMAMILELMGHEVETAHDGLAALEAAAAFRPDVMLLDIGLPKLNGYEVARSLRQQPWGEQVILIAVTGWGQEEDKRRALEAGCNYHLTKPIDPDGLEKLLATSSDS